MLSKETKKRIRKIYHDVAEVNQLKTRPGQKQLIASISNFLAGVSQEDAPNVFACQASTGIGKTLAYLTASIPVAEQDEKKIIISTATVTLQAQLLEKDLPNLLHSAQLNKTIALVKGRGRYVCLLKLEQMLHDPATFWDTMLFKEPVSESFNAKELYEAFAYHRWDGDFDNLEFELAPQYRQALVTTNRECTNLKCTFFKQCPFFDARKQVDKADILIVNHDLLLSDQKLGGGVILPPLSESILIIDEAHHIADKATSHYAMHQRWGNLIESIGQAIQVIEQHKGILEKLGLLDNWMQRIVVAHEQFEDLYRDTKHMLANWMTFESQAEEIDDKSIYRFKEGVLPKSLQEWGEGLLNKWQKSTDKLDQFQQLWDDLLQKEYSLAQKTEIEQFYIKIGLIYNRFSHISLFWSHFFQVDPRFPEAKWLSYLVDSKDSDFFFHFAPLTASHILFDAIWSKSYASVLVSATLKSMGEFNYFAEHAGLPAGTQYEDVHNSFDYAQAGQLLVPMKNCLPSNESQHDEVLQLVIRSEQKVKVGMLVIFSSRKQMNRVYYLMSENEQANILRQGDKNKTALLVEHSKRLNQEKISIIFGLASFAEGVDLPGNLLERLVIAKIPFAVPNTPEDAARQEWLVKQNKHPFQHWTLPQASLRLIQACGRLLRQEEDFGRVWILDERLYTKQYGADLIKGLPDFALYFVDPLTLK